MSDLADIYIYLLMRYLLYVNYVETSLHCMKLITVASKLIKNISLHDVYWL